MTGASTAVDDTGVWARPARPVLLAAMVTMGLTAPGQTVGISVFVEHFVADLGVSRSQLATAYLLGTATGALSMPFAGRLLDTRGLRFCTIGFGAGFAAVLVAMSGVTGLVTVTVGFAFTRMLGQGALTLTATTTVAVWFDRHRGAALGLLAAVGGGLMSLVPLASAAIITEVGWRWAWVVLGAVVAVVVVPIGLFVARDRPRSAPPPSAAGSSDAAPAVTPEPAGVTPEPTTGAWYRLRRRRVRGESVTLALRTGRFWVVTAATTLAATFGTALIFHQITLLTERGLTEVQAAANFLPQTVATATAAIVVGRLADRLAPRWLFAAATAGLGGAGVVLLAVDGVVSAAVYGIVLGGSGSALRTMEGTVLPRWFGTEQIGELRGIVLGAAVAGSAVGPLLLSVGNDVTGAYTAGVLAFVTLSALLALAALVVLPGRGDAPLSAARLS
ncbi:MAG: MFS transporter [Acidimicrobiia bacterium]|nr:MFS transporter [Acidimicrobiia bacterium]